ncbi:MerR family transcriptional regulator [Mycolicibacterium moriokaense]|nr:MerR family transcriptional regulator [Mycolicibacterium moriokaense]
MEFRIGDLAHATHTSAPTVRYYEQIGLLPPPERKGAQRRYTDEDVRRLTFVRRCRDFGFPIEQVRTLVALMHDGRQPCSQARDIAAAHLSSIREQLRELHALEASIAALIEAAEDVCSGGSGADCVMLDELAQPL